MTAATCFACKKETLNLPMGERDGFFLVACASCGSIDTSPLPPPDAQERLLAEIQPIVTHLPQPQKEVAKLKKTILRALGQGSGRSLLDVSARQGYVVQAAGELGFKASGIDRFSFYADFREKSKSALNIAQKSMTQAAAEGVQADAVVAFEALTEEYDLETAAAALAKIVKPGGSLYVEEVDGNHFNLPRNLATWRYPEPPLNFHYPSRDGLIALLGRHGFKKKKKFFNWQPFSKVLFVKSGG